MDDQTALNFFRDWLSSRNYTDLSIARSLDAARAVLEDRPAPWVKAAAKRMQAAFAEEPTVLPRVEAALEVCAEDRRARAFHGRKGRAAKRTGGIGAADWEALKRALAADSSAAGRALRLMVATGLRVGDVLRIDRTVVAEGARTGVYPIVVKGDKVHAIPHSVDPGAWASIEDLFASVPHRATVAAYVAPGGDGSALAGGAAYAAVRRKLQAHASACGISERVFTHRIRKSVAESIYEGTHDIVAVRDALGHENIAVSQRYLNTTSADRIAAAHRKRLR